MIKRINKLKNFGIFYDYQWESDLKEFNRFNLIYGWNRSGKTTFSRIFESCEKKCTQDSARFAQYPDNGEFEILTTIGSSITDSNISDSNVAIKVFNQDFIDENISFDPKDSCKPIVYISTIDIEKKEELERLKLSSETLKTNLIQAEQTAKEKNKQKDTFLTGLGREISNVLFDKTYNKTRAENKIKAIGVDKFSDKVLGDDDRIKFENISKSKADDQKILATLSEHKIAFTFNDLTLDTYQKVYDLIKTILGKKVVSETLDRLKDDNVLNNWVQQGFNLHKQKDEQKECLFCQNKLNDNFLDNLAKHFNTDYEQLQSSISTAIELLQAQKLLAMPPSSDDLYPDLRANYISKINEINVLIQKLNSWIDSLIEKLNKKSDNPLEIVDIDSEPEDFHANYNRLISEINAIISEHNEKLKNHSQEVYAAKEKLELHYLAVAVADQDYNKFETDVKGALDVENKSRSAFDENKLKINELEKQTSNIGTAINKINQHLKGFFGRKEIELELSPDNQGYIIKRNGKPARNLSEGEKTAIAFSYFIVKVEENDFKVKEGIFFIDDPISSFDSNSIYHCFSMIKNHFKDAKQLFISTHNFQFFNLVKKWFLKKNDKIKRNNEKLCGAHQQSLPCNFYMIKTTLKLEPRTARLSKLDATLEKYRSEYNYLFNMLSGFLSEEECSYSDLYTISNIARRFFDIFADFKIPAPDSCTPWDKLIKIVEEINKISKDQISNDEQEKVFGLINGYSHNDDPLSAVEHIDRTECVHAISIMLKIIRLSDPVHYSHLSGSNMANEIKLSHSLALPVGSN